MGCTAGDDVRERASGWVAQQHVLVLKMGDSAASATGQSIALGRAQTDGPVMPVRRDSRADAAAFGKSAYTSAYTVEAEKQKPTARVG